MPSLKTSRPRTWRKVRGAIIVFLLFFRYEKRKPLLRRISTPESTNLHILPKLLEPTGLEESPEVESEEEEGAASKKKGPKKGGKAKTKGKKAGGKGAQKRASRREDESPSEGSEAAAEAAQEPEPKKARVEEEEQEAMEESEEEDEGQPAGEAEGEGEEEAEAAGGAEVEEVPETQEPEEGLAPETQEPAAPAQAEKATEEHGVGEEEHEAPTAEPEEGAGTAAEVGETEEGAQPAEQTEQEAPSAGAVVEQGRISFYYRPKVRKPEGYTLCSLQLLSFVHDLMWKLRVRGVLWCMQVGVEDAESLQDVQRFYMVLAPVGGPKARLAVVGKKRLPSVEKHEVRAML